MKKKIGITLAGVLGSLLLMFGCSMGKRGGLMDQFVRYDVTAKGKMIIEGYEQDINLHFSTLDDQVSQEEIDRVKEFKRMMDEKKKKNNLKGLNVKYDVKVGGHLLILDCFACEFEKEFNNMETGR